VEKQTCLKQRRRHEAITRTDLLKPDSNYVTCLSPIIIDYGAGISPGTHRMILSTQLFVGLHVMLTWFSRGWLIGSVDSSCMR
jgi:hypothetical protein